MEHGILFTLTIVTTSIAITMREYFHSIAVQRKEKKTDFLGKSQTDERGSSSLKHLQDLKIKSQLFNGGLNTFSRFSVFAGSRQAIPCFSSKLIIISYARVNGLRWSSAHKYLLSDAQSVQTRGWIHADEHSKRGFSGDKVLFVDIKMQKHRKRQNRVAGDGNFIHSVVA